MRRYTRRDLPLLRAMRDAYRNVLAHIEQTRFESTDLDAGELVGFALIKAEITEKFQSVGRELSRLEATP